MLNYSQILISKESYYVFLWKCGLGLPWWNFMLFVPLPGFCKFKRKTLVWDNLQRMNYFLWSFLYRYMSHLDNHLIYKIFIVGLTQKPWFLGYHYSSPVITSLNRHLMLLICLDIHEKLEKVFCTADFSVKLQRYLKKFLKTREAWSFYQLSILSIL